MAKLYYTAEDIAKRYGIGINRAHNIIRGIKEFNGGLVLGRGKVMPGELAAWEQKYLAQPALPSDAP